MFFPDRLDKVGNGVDLDNAAGQDEGDAVAEALRLLDIMGG
jgi:hypothetical protein